MFKNHIKIAFRFFKKNKLFSAINVLGLAIGITAFLLLTQYVAFEKSYDEDTDDLYRVTISNIRDVNDLETAATNHPAVAPAMKADFPEVADYARLVDFKVIGTSGILSYKGPAGQMIKVNSKDYDMFYAEPALFDLFNIPMEWGDSKTALTEPISLVISSTIAHQFFGKDDPIGKEIAVNNDQKIKVTGVFQDLPENTHLQFDMLVSFSTLNKEYYNSTWIWPEFYNYVKLKPGTDPNNITSKFPNFVQKNMGEIMDEYGFSTEFHLQPVKDIHLKSHLTKEITPNSSEGTLYFLIIVAAFVIGIALINFINLSTSKSLERAKEVGMKKVVGAQRGTLVYQFLCESLIINFVALVLALILVSVLMKPFNNLVGLNILSMDVWTKSGVWTIVIAVFVAGGLLAGLYPAFVLSSFKPITVLKGKFSKSTKGSVLRKGLVVAQFAISIALISGTLIVYDQFSFMQNQELGFKADQNLVVTTPVAVDSTVQSKMEVFKNELRRSPNINLTTLTTDIPGKPMAWTDGIRKQGERKDNIIPLNYMSVDHDFLDTYKIDLLAGRNFNKDDADQYYPFGENGDTKLHRVILNETVVKALGFSDPNDAIGEKTIFKYGPVERSAEVIGVIKNYHQRSLQTNYENIMLMYDERYIANHLTVNISGNNVKGTLAKIETEFEKLFPNDAFGFFFLNEHFNQQYKADLKFGLICLIFSVLAIFIAALGLFGLGSHMAMQKVKEISVRKVLGASTIQALLLIPKSLLGLVLLSGTIAIPLVYFVTKNWLEGYAFKTDIGAWMFLVPLLLVMLVALLSILAQSLKSALVNPAASLRNE